MKISHRLLALSAFSAAGLLCVAGVSYHAVTSIQEDLRTLTLRSGPLQARTYELQERTERAIGGLLKLTLARDKADADKAGTSVTLDLQAIDKLREQLRALDPQARGEAVDLRTSQQEIVAAVQTRFRDDAAYRQETQSARAALQKAEEAIGSTRQAVQQIGVEAGKTADRAQDAARRLGQTAKLVLSAQAKLKEIAIVVGEVDLATNRFRLAPLKEKAKASVDAIQRLEVEAGSEDVLKEVRGVAGTVYDAFGKDNAGLLALRAASLTAKPETKADAEAAYQKQRRAVLAPLDEQATKLGAILDTAEVQAVKQRQALEAALKLRNEPGGVVATSDDISLDIREMTGRLRLLMLAADAAEVKSARDDLERLAAKLGKDMGTMRAGLLKMGRPQLAAQVDAALEALGSVSQSSAKVAQAKDGVLAGQARMTTLMDQLKERAQKQASVGEAQVQAMATRQAEISGAVDRRVGSSLSIILAIAGVIIAASVAVGLHTSRSIRRRLEQAVKVAEEVSCGHLVAVPPARHRDETDRLLDALGKMVSTLTGMVGNIAEASSQIDVGSSEIRRGNEDLSVRTEQQAAQLQQTAASVEQLTATVQHNAESARHANALAGQASQVATRGGEIVGQVVSTMGDIERSSKQIGEIVGVIDGIAFQTNILALNAAVEAARAGEHGRGFAVVASEVRALAKKSGEAAQQVKTIVQSSVGKISVGANLVQGAGETMHEIVEQVTRVTQLIAEIARASEEQASSIGTVGSAVSQLDALTQQNSALAEQSTAAAKSLREQAEGLSNAIAAFRLQRIEA